MVFVLEGEELVSEKIKRLKRTNSVSTYLLGEVRIGPSLNILSNLSHFGSRDEFVG